MKINNSHAIVTGGASGLGFATAVKLLQMGAKVSIIDINEPKNETKVDFYKCDVTNNEEVMSVLDSIFDNSSVPRILVQCAGIVHAAKTVSRNRENDDINSYPIDQWERVININLVGTFRVLSYFSKKLVEKELPEDKMRGVIINTASVAATDGQIGQSSYTASKAGIMGMTLPIARDLSKEGIRINCVLPGIFNTPMVAGMPDKVKDALSASIPFPSRLGEGDDFASLAVQMIENDYINGASYRLDGAVRLAPR